MYNIEDSVFDKLVTNAIDSVPEPYSNKIHNMGFFVEDEPTDEQRKRLGLRPCQSLFGLYEGVPLPARQGQNGNLLPGKITIFRLPHRQFTSSEQELVKQINNTVWHEVAHYFGLGHDRIHDLERKYTK